MRAIDTNIVVRLLTADDPEQAIAAKRIIEAGDIFLGVTVLLEAEWVLRAGYGFDATQIASALRGLSGLPGLSVEEPTLLATALEWLEGGMDFADALHLVRSGHCSAFVTFDRKLAKRAQALAATPVIIP
ncbi:type II toxin-antitoxin system VapC family toxin [Novosphingobium sp. Fuku2-ISO-50]|uniref:type II toxin-antitoxin system VapC family toxin n=1 Tax=Novosphingobium sp. Fuku2-ISO-50 TaxID=1739114 RepID=UPI00076DD91C|nr:type II toxin-antitoxin system VapC family toxin [Novosphingobium sp. Fuku2-ISO-50]KUR75301.1 twitching motility protein PilT [Novosphingobium sp. Fuku2-ISO-50]